jgi:hypothetical protein
MTDDIEREAFIDAGARVLAGIRDEWSVQKQLIEAEARQLVQTDLDAMLTPLRERIAKLEGQMTVLLGGDSTNNPTRSKRSKQSPDNGQSRLLEHRPQ